MPLFIPFQAVHHILYYTVHTTVDTSYLCIYFIDHQLLLFAAHSTTMLLDQDLVLQ